VRTGFVLALAGDWEVEKQEKVNVKQRKGKAVHCDSQSSERSRAQDQSVLEVVISVYL
jgi:hypothetical protein